MSLMAEQRRKEGITEIEDRSIDIIQSEKQKEKIEKNEQSLRGLRTISQGR